MNVIYIYVASNDHGLVKVGCSKNVQKRVRQLETGQPYSMKLIAFWPGDKELESAIHRRLRKYRIKDGRQREWYEPTSELKATIAAIKVHGLSESYIKNNRRRKDIVQKLFKDKRAKKYPKKPKLILDETTRGQIIDTADYFYRQQCFDLKPYASRGSIDFIHSVANNVLNGGAITYKQILALRRTINAIMRDVLKAHNYHTGAFTVSDKQCLLCRRMPANCEHGENRLSRYKLKNVLFEVYGGHYAFRKAGPAPKQELVDRANAWSETSDRLYETLEATFQDGLVELV